MADTKTQTCDQGIRQWLRAVGWGEFVCAWRGAFRVELLLVTSVGVAVSFVWAWLLGRLWEVGGGTPVLGSPSAVSRMGALTDCFRCQALSQHWFYLLCLVVPLLFLWSLLGGAAHRLIAFQNSGKQETTLGRALEYSLRHYWRGFFLTWMLPLAFCLFVGGLVFLYGMFVAIPWLGDLLGGVFFFVPLGLGCLLTFGLLVLALGGNLLVPAVAVGGAHGADAVTHSVAYLLSKPLRAIGYLVATCLVAWAAALVLMGSAEFAQSLTWKLVSSGEGIWSNRGASSGSDRISQFLFDCWWRGLDCLVIGAVLNVFFAGSVVSFVLLREAVDGVGRQELDPAGVELPQAGQDEDASGVAAV